MRYPDRTISSNSEPAPVLADLPIFDLIKDTSLDQMHAVDIGVFLKSYFTMMFIDSTNNKDQPFFLGENGKECCHEIMSKFDPHHSALGVLDHHMTIRIGKPMSGGSGPLLLTSYVRVYEYMVEKGLLEKKYYDNWLRLVIATASLIWIL